MKERKDTSNPLRLECDLHHFRVSSIWSSAVPLVTTNTVLQIEVQKRKGESIPLGWAVDSGGNVTDDPCKVLDQDGGLLYLGGPELNGGYKGYGLGMMVEVLGGILGGGPFGQNIRRWKNDSRIANLVSFWWLFVL